MAMVVIERDGKTMKVPYGAFKNSFERTGWEVTDGSKNEKRSSPNKNTNGRGKTLPEASDESTKVSEEKDEWDEADEELEMEKSIDEMDLGELKKFAESKGINTKELKTVGALKKAIKSAM